MEGALFGGWAGDEPASKWWQKNMTFYGPGGIGLAQNAKEFQQHVLDPYHAAFTNRSVEASMMFCEGNYCGAYGNLLGDHVGTWVGLPASSKRLSLRFCMHFRVVEGLISEGWAIFDFPGLFNQIGLDFYAKARDQTPLPVES
uniref:SnoaL-like domain-containing protein n=1 Tax=Alexandrium andersonii TaxID=327968 RepID=A0A7S2FJR1_9DINO|mmetsp:Transcript_2676/g.6044  ORF Transcript_2676/g.6044 Transcript_2676/m.6044 type:complete len:143 (+) Transcript_2676:1-429(+)